ncbi:SRPBCC family protein [Hyphococcus luteus]|uniref:Activator of Hsp90 ATPase homologue 1/2-like C-terminal domain-containing protein n=1 Tax=Hyphococcus luteus TaxID=2058213 RepID=A0A2S7K5J6_9PROT|nr:SRPBCC domain-containing protein [Marinicaulis flavus]PQA87751.1 hypothetical protein CW354_05155 [Marinicaulis flavus]
MPIIPNELRMSRVYNAPRPLVWKVWTDPEHLKQWWGPFGPERTSCMMDFRVGGEFRVLMKTPEGEVAPAAGEFLEIVEPERIVYEGEPQAPTACGCGLPPKSRVTVLFEALAAAKTRLVIETVFPDADALEAANASGFSASWNRTLDEMGPYLERLMEESR